jgi:hypothetical protein
MTDVHCARVTMSLHGKTDKFGAPMVSIFHLIWAARVLIWFSRYIKLVRSFVTRLEYTWNSAVSQVWDLIRSNSIAIKDTP